MRTIAIEEHFLSQAFQEVVNKGLDRHRTGASKAFMEEREKKLCDLGEIRLKDMDVAGIDFQVLSHTAAGISSIPGDEGVQWTREANDQLAEAVKAYPDRFGGFAILPMAEPKAAADELERAIHALGFKGAVINGTTNGRFLDDPFFLPILECAAALDVPIYLHPAEPPEVVRNAYYSGFDPAANFALSTSAWGWHSELGIHVLRMMLGGVFDRLPNLQIIIGHMGEMLPFMLARSTSSLAASTKHLQRTIPEYFLENFSITTSGFFTEPPFLLALQVVGADRIIFSVDYPYSTNEQGHTFLDNVSISPADKEKISHLNAERLLKLE